MNSQRGLVAVGLATVKRSEPHERIVSTLQNVLRIIESEHNPWRYEQAEWRLHDIADECAALGKVTE